MTKKNLPFILLFLSSLASAASYTYIKGPSLIESLSTTATSGSTTTLVATDNMNQEFTGSSAEIVALPDATTMAIGQSFYIINRSTQAVTVKDGSGSTLQILPSVSECRFLLVANGAAAGTWTYPDVFSLNAMTGKSQTFATASTGTDFVISSAGNIHTFAIPDAGASARGLLTSTDWTTFNNKQNALPSPTPSGSPLVANGSGEWVVGSFPPSPPTSPLTTAGDIYTYSTTNDRLPVATGAKVLMTDLTSSTKLKWASPPTGINYIVNHDAETTTTSGWALYKDSAAAIPDDATGGSPTFAITTTSTSPLRYSNSFLMTPSALGEGSSYYFYIDSADVAKVLTVSFDYSIGTVASYTTGDITIWIVPVNGSYTTPIQCAPYQIEKTTSPEQFKCEFQGTADATQYRLAFHQSTAATGYTLKIDDVRVGPPTKILGTPVTDELAATPGSLYYGSTAATNVGSSACFYSRVGDKMNLKCKYVFNGAANANGAIYAALPSGFTVDSAKLPAGLYEDNLGRSTFWTNSSTVYGGQIVFFNGKLLFRTHATAGTAYTSDAWAGNTTAVANRPGGVAIANNDVIYFEVHNIPIAGWSSSTVMSDVSDTRVVAATTNATPTSSAFNDSAYVIFSSMSFDTHSAYSTSTGLYTAPIAGIYEFTGQLGITGSSAGTYLDLNFYKNGSSTRAFNTSTLVTGEQFVPYSYQVSLIAGDTVGVRWSTDKSSPAVSGGTGKNVLNIKRISGPSQIAASETVKFSAYDSSSNVINGTANYDFGTSDVVEDSHGGFNASTDTYTIPSPGLYALAGRCNGGTGSSYTVLGLLVNSVEKRLGGMAQDASIGIWLGGYHEQTLNAGSTVTLQVITGASTTIANCHFSVSKKGN